MTGIICLIIIILVAADTGIRNIVVIIPVMAIVTIRD